MNSRREFVRWCAALSVSGVAVGDRGLFAQASGAVQGTATPASLAAVVALMTELMEKQGVSAGQIAVCKDGGLVLSKAFATKPPAGFAAVNSQSLFRIASCSKMFTCAAITRLRSRGDLDMDAKVFPMLGINAPAMPKDKPDPRIDEITVRQLVDHAGGWNDHESVVAKDGTHVPGTEWDPMSGTRQIALEMHLDRPATKLELAQYMYGKKLQFAPGSQNFNSTAKKSYSNVGYMLLGLVIEKVSGGPYLDFIRTELGPESDTSNVYLSRLLEKTKNPREVWYTSSRSGPTQLNPRSGEVLSEAYGGAYLPEQHESAGGLMTNAETLALFASKNAVWGLGGRSARSGRSGSLPGTSSFTCSRPNGVDGAFILNTRDFRDGEAKLDEFIGALQGLLDRV